jgi:hypothetical protein
MVELEPEGPDERGFVEQDVAGGAGKFVATHRRDRNDRKSIVGPWMEP